MIKYNIFKDITPRTRQIIRHTVFSFIIKGWSAIIIFLLIPITLKCLGEYENGVWLTISSMLIWIDQLDIGLGNGMRNKIATYMAENKYGQARKVVSSTFFMLICIIVPTTIFLLIGIYTIDLYAFIGVDNKIVGNLSTIVAMAVSMICATFIFKFIGKLYMGLQMPAVNNFLSTGGQTIALVLTYILYYTGQGTLFNIVLVNTSSPLLIYIIMYPYTFCYKYPQLRPAIQCIDKAMIKEVLSIGIKFFVIQIATVMIFVSSNTLISKYFSPAIVTPYQAAYRFFNIALIIFGIINLPYWSATTDAWTRQDKKWIKQSIKTMTILMLLLLVFIGIMVACSGLFYKIWLNDMTKIPFGMTVSIAIYTAVIIISMTYSNFLNGVGAFNLQLITTIIASILYIPLTLLLIKLTNNVLCVIIAMALVYAPGVIINYIQLKKIVNSTAKGIWTK